MHPGAKKKIIVLVTASSSEEADNIARTIVEEKLAACCNIVPDVKSIFHWQGKIDQASELLLVFKTQEDKFEDLASRVKKLHSYEVPEIIALPIEKGSADYLKWIEESL